DADVGVEPLELGYERAHLFALAAEGPEADGGDAGGLTMAADRGSDRQGKRERSAHRRQPSSLRAHRVSTLPMRSVDRPLQPSTSEAGALEPTPQVLVAPHQLPHQAGAVVL